MKLPAGPGPWYGPILAIVSPDRRRELDRERARRRRERKREGQTIVQVAINLDRSDTLIARGYLQAWDAEDRSAIAAAIETLLDDLDVEDTAE